MAYSLTVSDLNDYAEIISEHVSDANVFSTFVETGTAEGNSVRSVSRYFDKVFTVEISEVLFNQVNPYLQQYENVEHVFGDSLIEVPKFLESLGEDEKVFFWLDAHWSQGLSSKNHLDCPLIEECKMIDQTYKSDIGLVVIDDLRLFETNENEDWSQITKDAVKNAFERFKVIVFEEINDRLLVLIKK